MNGYYSDSDRIHLTIIDAHSLKKYNYHVEIEVASNFDFVIASVLNNPIPQYVKALLRKQRYYLETSVGRFIVNEKTYGCFLVPEYPYNLIVNVDHRAPASKLRATSTFIERNYSLREVRPDTNAYIKYFNKNSPLTLPSFIN